MKNYLSNDLSEDLKSFLEGIQPPYNVVEFDRLGVEYEETFLDPITNCIINFPVILNGVTYDFDTIDKLDSKIDPFNNKPFKMSDVVPDILLNEKIKTKLSQAKQLCDTSIKKVSSTEIEIKINKAIELFLNHRINGNFTFENLDIPIHDLAELASKFNPKAQYLYAVCFEIGFNVSKSSQKYVKYLRYAVEQGLGIAQLSYANCCEDGRHGITKDLAEAAKYYELAADQGITISLYNYGQCLAFGLGVEQDLIKAAYCFKKAADGGYSKAQYNYAACCEKGYGVTINHGEAEKYYKLAEKNGLSSIQGNILATVNTSSKNKPRL